MRTLICVATLVACSVAVSAQVATAPTPPMGWNSWNHFATHVRDADVRSAADALVSSGMRDAGYVYVNVDDAWQGQRDAHGVLHPNERFPDMKALGDYLHARGLKFGISPASTERIGGACRGMEPSCSFSRASAVRIQVSSSLFVIPQRSGGICILRGDYT